MFSPRPEPRPVGRIVSHDATPYAPPGWPPTVRAPGAPDWERTAVNWILDNTPPEYRGYPELRRNPAVLARFAVLHTEACQAAVDRGLSEARGVLREVAAPHEVAGAVAVWEREKARLLGVRRAAGLIEDALAGRRYVPSM